MLRAHSPAFAALILASITAPSASAQRAVILIRHAEKVTEAESLQAAGIDPGKLQDPEVDRRVPLSKAGKARAEALALALAKLGIDAIYTSQADRTKQTARPLAEALGIEPKPIERRHIEQFGEQHRDQVVLIVGHSNTVPQIIDGLTRRSNNIVIGDDAFDNLFILLPRKDDSWGLLRSRY